MFSMQRGLGRLAHLLELLHCWTSDRSVLHGFQANYFRYPAANRDELIQTSTEAAGCYPLVGKSRIPAPLF